MRMCSIASGSSGNCIYVGSDHTHLLVDTGISRKRIEEGLKQLEIKGEEIDGVLITHEHSDHIQGLGVLSRKYELPIYATKGTIEGISACTSLGKMPEGLFHTIHADEPFQLGDIEVKPFSTMPVNLQATVLNAAESLRRLLQIWASMMNIRYLILQVWMRSFWRRTMIFICWKSEDIPTI